MHLRAPSSVGIDVTFPIFEQKQSLATKRDKLPATVGAELKQPNLGKLYWIWFTVVLVTIRPAPIALHGPETQPHPINPCLPMHMGLPPKFLWHILQPFPDDDVSNANSEHHLDSALAILIQTSGILADGVCPQARDTLGSINALGFYGDTTDLWSTPYQSAWKVVKWLQISRSPK